MIMQYMAASNLRRYLDVLPKIVENFNNTYHTTIKSTLAAVWAGDHIGQARKNIKANVDKMLAPKVKTKGVSTQVPKTSNYVQVSLVHIVGSERELDLKGFCKHTGRNYSDDIYKVETIKPRKVSHNEFVISEAFVWVQGKRGPGHYDQGSGKLLPAIFYATNLLVVPKPQVWDPVGLPLSRPLINMENWKTQKLKTPRAGVHLLI